MIKYEVKHPLLKQHIKFFWELKADYMKLNHKVIPVRNIDLKFNLSDTPHYLNINEDKYLLEEVYFSGLQDHYRNAQILLEGKVHVIGICFYPYGFYPFLKIPLSEIKNQLLGANEVGFYQAITICNKLKEVNDTKVKLDILENELLALYNSKIQTPRNFDYLFNSLMQNGNTIEIAEFSRNNNIGIRKLERIFKKYIGISAKTFKSLNRFQEALNHLLYSEYDKLSDIAYENDFFDQMHFIREFKRFTGNTPKRFICQNNSMVQVGN
jgi:AraC-like DNA-binding protein